MKLAKLNCLLATMIMVGLCAGCDKTSTPSTQQPSLESTPSEEVVGPYGKKIVEDLQTTNILDDNYRNFYEIFVYSFRDSDGDGKGDLQGVIEKLDYVKDLGFTGIWLMPIHPSLTYHKYDVKDYYSIDPSYGTMEDFEKLIEECHKRDIKLIIDMVLNHSSSANEHFIKAIGAHQKEITFQELTEEEEIYKDYYTFYDDEADIPSGVIAYQAAGKTFYYEGNFSSGMPEFNCDNPHVRQEFKNILKFYLDKGIDGFRFDAVKYFYINDMNKNIELLSELNTYVKSINPKAYLVGECWSGDTTIAEYYKSGFDSFFNFSASVSNPSGYVMNSINRMGSSLSMYANGLKQNIDLANGYIPAPFIDNHDMPRFTPSIEDLSDTKYQYALLSMLNGATFTYYGSEVGMIGTNTSGKPDQDVRLPMRWGEEDKKGDVNLQNFKEITKASYPHGTVKEQMEDPNSLYNFYKKCLLIRNQHPEIARGAVEQLALEKQEDDHKELFIKKTYNGSSIGIVFNFSPVYDLEVNYKQYGFNEVVGQIVVNSSDERYVGILENGNIKMPSYSIAIVK